jgi:RHS repeat-associated protein
VLAESGRNGTVQEEYVYFAGRRIARRDVPTNTVHYYFADHLGSASVITDSSGNVQEQSDYYPYGGIAYSSGADANHYKFTGKEHDAESGNDYFGARYYASIMGRWLSPDKPFADQHVESPQSWNLYSYTRNNPLKYVDPDGEEVTFANTKLQQQFMNIASQSPTLMGEYETAKDDNKMDVQVVERGVRRNDQGSQGDTTVSTTNDDGVTKVVVYVDPYWTSDEMVSHEWGHEKDAREQGGTAFVVEGLNEKKMYPDKGQHDDRPQEQSANRFRDQVSKERKAFKKKQKDKKKAERNAIHEQNKQHDYLHQ